MSSEISLCLASGSGVEWSPQCAGHALHAELVRALLRDHAAWTIETGTAQVSGYEYAVASA